MAVRTGISHALATLLLTLISALIVNYLNHIGASSQLFELLNQISLRISQWLSAATSISLSEGVIAPIIVASMLTFVWGVIFHYVRFRER